MIKLPFAENQEETRILTLDVIRAFLDKKPELFISVADKICMMLAAVLQDGNPDMKSLAASFSSELALKLGSRVGKYFRDTIASMTVNL
jgi:hypothetical protein